MNEIGLKARIAGPFVSKSNGCVTGPWNTVGDNLLLANARLTTNNSPKASRWLPVRRNHPRTVRAVKC
jgi:hypothetical protein